MSCAVSPKSISERGPLLPRGLCLTAVAVILSFGLSRPARGAAAQRPNVVLIIFDDLNDHGLNHDYPQLRMPNLDRFRAQAINFTQAACGVSVCNPSRACFLSGLDAYHTGAYLNGADAWNKPGSRLEHIQSLPEYFKSGGYTTWGRGKVFHSPLPKEREEATFDNRPLFQGGFGPFPDEAHWIRGSKFGGIQPWTGPDSDFPDVVNGDAAIEFLGKGHDKPFLLIYGLWRPHAPYTAPKRFFDQYNVDEMKIPPGWRPDDLEDVPPEGRALTDGNKRFANADGTMDEKMWRKYLQAYCANCSFADWSVGRVLDALNRSAYASNTVVIVCSDNGFHCGEKKRWEKGTLWELSDRVPLLVRVPGDQPAECTRTVGLVDLYPTLQEICHLPAPDHPLDGRSFAALLENPTAPWDRPSLTIYGKGNASVRDERYRYIHYANGGEELYDLKADPHEFTNLAADSKSKPIIQRLAARLPRSWAPSWGGRWEVPRPGEPDRQAPEYPLPAAAKANVPPVSP